MSRITQLAKKKLVIALIESGALRSKKIRIKDRDILFPDLSNSNLLKEIAFGGYRAFESEVVTLIEKYPWRIDRFVDAGANIGFYSILGSIFFDKKVEIIAVEPFLANVEYIKKIRKINNLDFALDEKALDKVAGREVTMYYPTAKSSSKLASSASLVNSFKGTGGIYKNLPYKTINVKTTTLPRILGDDGRGALIKLDCEGNELNILAGSEGALKRGNVDFIIEIMINDSDKQAIYDMMAGYGYRAYLVTNAGFVREDRPLTFPYPAEDKRQKRTLWKSHFFTKRDPEEIRSASLKIYGFFI